MALRVLLFLKINFGGRLMGEIRKTSGGKFIRRMKNLGFGLLAAIHRLDWRWRPFPRNDNEGLAECGESGKLGIGKIFTAKTQERQGEKGLVCSRKKAQ
jgi:hypothetical protein